MFALLMQKVTFKKVESFKPDLAWNVARVKERYQGKG